MTKITNYAAIDIEKSADAFLRETGLARHQVAVVMGSGWAEAADHLGVPNVDFSIESIPGLPAPTVPGHIGRIRSVSIGGKNTAIFLGRTHLYEGHGVSSVVQNVRVAVAIGARLVVLTNAAGGIREDMNVGDTVLLADQLNLTGRSPIAGSDFVDLTNLYSGRLRDLARQIDPTLTEGVYAQVPGPHYETPSEVVMLRRLGADLVGMSTALEAIAARHAGATEILGISLVTNLAAGMTGQPLAHQEILETGRAAAGHVANLLATLIAAA